MKLACQINSYAGDGSKLQTKYKFCYLELDTESKKGEITFKEYGEYSEKIKFNLQELKFNELVISLKATNVDGYGKIDLCLGDYGTAIHDLACINEEVQRLNAIRRDSENYFVKTHFSGKTNEEITDYDIYQLARKTFDENREDFRKNTL